MTAHNENLLYYGAQSPITDLEQYSSLFDDLPCDIPTLRDVTRCSHMHLEEGKMYGIRIPRSRSGETSLRSVQKMLDHMNHPVV